MTVPSQRTLAGILLLIVAVVTARPYFESLRAPSVGTFHDDGVYVVTAKALATGQGYRIVSLPGQPAQTKYPILFPLLLSVVWRVAPRFPANLPWLRLVPFGAALAWFYLSWRVIRRFESSPLVAAAAIALTVAASWTLFLSTSLLSETLFAALVAGGLLLIHQIEVGDKRWWAAVAAGLLFGAALLTRTAALAPVAAGLLSLSLRRKWRSALEFGAAAAIVVAPWLVWSALHSSDPIVDPFYSAANYRSWNIVFNYAWPEKFAVLFINTMWAIQAGQYWGLFPGTTAAWIAVFVCVPCAIRGMWILRHSAIALATALYVGLVLAWAFPPPRFLVPVLPFLIWFVFVGSGRLKPLVGALAVLVLVTASLQTQQLGRTIAERGGVWFEPAGVDDWSLISDLFTWVNTNTAPDAVVIATHDPSVYLFTGRAALRPSTMDPLMLYYNVTNRTIDPAVVDETFRQRVMNVQASYVVITPRDDDVASIDRLSQKYPGSFTLVYGSVKQQRAVYQIDRAQLARDRP